MSSPKIYGLLGYPVKHSLSPVMHNVAFKALGIPAEYLYAAVAIISIVVITVVAYLLTKKRQKS